MVGPAARVSNGIREAQAGLREPSYFKRLKTKLNNQRFSLEISKKVCFGILFSNPN